MRALLVIGAALDVIAALFLLLVLGWVIDAWHDPRMPWAGAFVTVPWALAFALCAGAPLFAYWGRKRGTPLPRLALAVWAPSLLLAAICIVGLVLTPP